MKKNLSFLIALLLCAFTSYAQRPQLTPEMQNRVKQAQEKMQQAIKDHPEIQQYMQMNRDSMAAFNKRLDSLKKTDPNYANVKLPDADAVVNKAMSYKPDFDKIAADQKAREAQLAGIRKQMDANNAASLPKKGSGVGPVSAIDTAMIRKWAGEMQATAKSKLGVILTPVFEKVYHDTTRNASALGMFYVANGLPKWVAHFMTSRRLLDYPTDPMAINDLGVLMRGDKDLKRALQCFYLAEKLNDSNLAIKTNIAWATAYNGDLIKARSLFDAILKKNPDFGPAMEGQSVVAFQMGDRATVWNNLSKQLLSNRRTAGFSGGPGPTTAALCGGMMTEDEMNKMDKGGKSNANGPSNAANSVTEPPKEGQGEETSLEGTEPVDYPSYKPDFPTEATEISGEKTAAAMSKYTGETKALYARLATLRNKLPIPKPTQDADGNTTTPVDWGADVHTKCFQMQHQNYGMQTSPVVDKCGEKIAASLLSTMHAFSTEFGVMAKALAGCPPNDEQCINDLKCQYFPGLARTLTGGIAAMQAIWEEDFQKIDDIGGAYISSSHDLIRFVSQKDWNRYLNGVREVDIRSVELRMMALYQNTIAGFIPMAKQMQGAFGDLSCWTALRMMPSSPVAGKTRKLKTYPGPCYKEAIDLNLVLARYQDNCDFTRFEISVSKDIFKVSDGPASASLGATVKAFWEKHYSKRAVEDDYMRKGIDLIVAAKASTKSEGTIKVKGPDGKEHGVKVGAGPDYEVSGTLTRYTQYDAQGRLQKTGYQVSGSVSTEMNAGLTLESPELELGKKNLSQHNFQSDKYEFGTIAGPDGSLGGSGVSVSHE